MDSMNTGIYCIEHKESGKKYVGSAVNIEKRWREHRHFLLHNKHSSKHLQAAWNMYGEEAFEFRKLLICSKENLLMYEQRCMDGYEVCNREKGYNLAVTAGSQLGMKRSPETLERFRKASLGRKFSAETRALLSRLRKGKPMPPGFGAKVTLWKTGSKHTDEAKAKISAAHKGRPKPLWVVEQRSKLTLEKAEAIRTRVAAGEKQGALAIEYGVSPSAISNVITRKRWASAYGT